MTGASPVGSLLVVTDLDGCLLDEETYTYEPAREALAALEQRRVPLVLCSSKTRAEMELLARVLGLDAPLIVENGGALLVPAVELRHAVPGARARKDGDVWVLELGLQRRALVPALVEIALEAGARVRGFSKLSAEDIEILTGLPLAAATLALQREYDEPFILETPEREEALGAAAAGRGLRVTYGGRFHHLTGPTDKGRAFQNLIELYHAEGRRFATVGIGDSMNDLEMLQAVERPILVPHPPGAVDPALAARLPMAEQAPAPGPRGWNAAVLAVLRGERLPPASAPQREGGPTR